MIAHNGILWVTVIRCHSYVLKELRGFTNSRHVWQRVGRYKLRRTTHGLMIGHCPEKGSHLQTRDRNRGYLQTKGRIRTIAQGRQRADPRTFMSATPDGGSVWREGYCWDSLMPTRGKRGRTIHDSNSETSDPGFFPMTPSSEGSLTVPHS